MIFDNLALYPNRTGFENIAHPLRVRKQAKALIDDKVHGLAATLQVTHILNRLPKTMSGGERQRVALGRALVRDLHLFLLDEPLSSLDAMLRVELRAELKRLQQEHHYSFLLATPDFTEALSVADTIIMLVQGHVRQVGSPQEIYDNPADRDVAKFVGAPEINLIPAELAKGKSATLSMLGITFKSPAALTKALGAGPFEAGLRPEHIKLTKRGKTSAPAEITDIEPLGIQSAVTLDVSGTLIRTTVPAATAEILHVGQALGIAPALNRLLAFDHRTGQRLG
jgi:multiple sugar transport system ATP-binding protein